MNISVYMSNTLADLRGLCIDNFVLDISGLQAKRNLVYDIELPHPTVILDTGIIQEISFTVGDYINFEVDNVIILRTIITNVKKNHSIKRIVVQTSDILIELKGYTAEDLIDLIESGAIQYTEEQINISSIEYDNYAQLIFLLLPIMQSMGLSRSTYICNIMEEYSPYTFYTETQAYNLLYKEIGVNLRMIWNLGKSAESDQNSTNLLELFLNILKVLQLRYTYNESNIIISKYEVINIAGTYDDYTVEDIERKGLEVSWEFIDPDGSTSPLYDLYITSWDGTITSTGDSGNNDKEFLRVTFPANFYLFALYGNRLYPILFEDEPWTEEEGLPWQFMEELSTILFINIASSSLSKITTYNPLSWTTNFYTCSLDLGKVLSKLEFIIREGS